MPATEWQKSSYCAQGDSCVHVAGTDDGHVHLTESSDPSGSILTTTPARFRALLDAVRAGGSSSGGIEVSHEAGGGVVRLRETGVVVTTTSEKWDAFVRGAKDGEFDHFA